MQGPQGSRGELVKVSLCHKKFVVLTKMVDLLTENAAHEDGVNLYQDGANIGLAFRAS